MRWGIAVFRPTLVQGFVPKTQRSHISVLQTPDLDETGSLSYRDLWSVRGGRLLYLHLGVMDVPPLFLGVVWWYSERRVFQPLFTTNLPRRTRFTQPWSKSLVLLV